MNLRRTPEQEALTESLDRLLAKLSDPERVREIEQHQGGFDPELWAALRDLGVPEMATPEGGATVADLAVVADRCGAHLASAPVIESLVAARAGIAGAAFTPAPGTLAPWAAVSDVVLPDGDRLVRLGATGEVVASLGCRASGRVDRSCGSTVPADARAVAEAVTAWRALTAAWLAGLARSALALGVQYAKDRHQFGVPIGSFQALQHRLADLHAAVDGAALLAHDAVAAIDAGDPHAHELATAALAWSGEQAEAAAAFSLHVHGGYGFMVEYAIHLYVKRAKAVRLEAGDPRRLLVELAHLRWDRPHDRGLGRGLPVETVAFQEEVRAFVAEHVTDDLRRRAHETGTMHDWGLHRALAERGWLSAGWPEEVGGQGRSALDVTVLQQALYEAGAPVDGMGIATMVAATLALLGNDWQRHEVLPRLLAGDALPCLGYSEPDAGSDVAAVSTRAVRADGSDDWIIDGQKMFTTMAHEASYVFLLARTSTDKPKHKGLTMFLVPMDTPGITVTPVHTLGGERTNITWYDGVRVPDRCRVGEVDAGWSVMHAALVYERNGANWGEPHGVLEAAAAAADLGDLLVAERLGAAAVRDEVGRLLLLRTAWMAAEGALPQVEGSMAKLFITEWFTAMSSDLLDLLGPDAVEAGFFEHAYRHATVTTIYGGSSEVQRGIIAERGLGLPRTR